MLAEITREGQPPLTLAHKSALEVIKAGMAEAIGVPDLSEKEIRTMMCDMAGVFMNLDTQYKFLVPVNKSHSRSAVKGFAIDAKNDRHKKIDRKRFKTLARDGFAGKLVVRSAVVGMSKFIKKIDPQASAVPATIRKCRKKMEAVGAFKVVAPPKGTKGCGRCVCTRLTSIDLGRVAILYELLEEELVRRGLDIHNPEEFPRHKFYYAVMFYNALFQGVSRFRRQEEEQPLIWECSDEDIDAFWLEFLLNDMRLTPEDTEFEVLPDSVRKTVLAVPDG
jgi:hypothetical protein